MKNYIKLFLCLSPFSSVCPQAQAKSMPNVILIMADDLGWGDVGFNGNKR